MQNKSYQNKVKKQYLYLFFATFIIINISLFLYTKQQNSNSIKIHLAKTANLIVNNLEKIKLGKENLIDLLNLTHIKITKNGAIVVLENKLSSLNEKKINNFHFSNKKDVLIKKESNQIIFFKCKINTYTISLSQFINQNYFNTYMLNKWVIAINVIFLLFFLILTKVSEQAQKKIMRFSRQLAKKTKSLSFINNYLKYDEFNNIYKKHKLFLKNQLNNNINSSYADIINTIDDGIILIKENSRIEYINENAKKYLISYNKKDNVYELDQLIRHKKIDLILERLKNDETEIKEIITMYLPQKKYINFVAKKLEFHDKAAILLIFKDITKLTSLENMRKEFVENVTHELKTPLTVINGFLETIKNERLDKTQKETFLEIISNQTIRISSIIDNLIFLTELEDFKYQNNTNFKKENLNNIVKNALESSLQKAEEKQIKLIFDEQNTEHANVNEILFYQVVVNLIDNAIKYSEYNKKVKIKFEKNENHIKLLIIDEGNGIEKKHLPFLFQRFYRVDKSRNRKTGGSGLGLSIAKHIMQLHKGDISVTSIPDHGSTFICTLPLEKGEKNE